LDVTGKYAGKIMMKYAQSVTVVNVRLKLMPQICPTNQDHNTNAYK
jgi:hypothetical protein